MTAGDWQRQLQEWRDAGSFFSLLPEVAALKGVSQPVEFHAEGDVLTHTLLAVEAVADNADERVFWAVLLHDIGKAQTTEFIDGTWRSYGHVACGARMVPAILDRFNLNHLSQDVSWLVKHHHFALDWGDYVFSGLTARQQKFCTLPLFPLLVEVCRADASASIGKSRKGALLDMVLVQLSTGGSEKQ